MNRKLIQHLVNMRRAHKTPGRAVTHHHNTTHERPPTTITWPALNLHLDQATTERHEVSEGQQSVCTYNTLPFHRACIYQLIDIDFIYMLFSACSALPSSPLQLLSNKSAPARLFNKHFAPSDECAALLKCLFSFCLGGQPTVVYLTVNKELGSLQLHASSPQ